MIIATILIWGITGHLSNIAMAGILGDILIMIFIGLQKKLIDPVHS